MGRRSAGWLATLVLLVPTAGCTLLGSDGERGAAGLTSEEFVAEAEAYLAALRDGDLEAAWARVCQDGFGASDRATFDARHGSAPRPVSWQLAYAGAGSGTGRSAAPGGGGGTPPGAAATVELEDGTSGEVRLLYGTDGLCQIVGDDPVVAALDPAPQAP